ncbi:MAG: response regulator [Thermoanaerobacteraceae bacterium]
MIKIVIVDDHIMFRQGLKAVIELESDIRVIGEASNENETIKVLKKNLPDILLMDIKLPDSNGIDVCEEILTNYPQLKVIMITAFHSEKDMISAIRAGAKGYVLKDSNIEELLRQIRLIHEGKNAIDFNLIDTVLEEIRKPNKKNILSKREQQIVKLIFEGLSNNEISEKLFISESTVKMHVHKIMEKLGVTSRTLIVRESLKRGLVDI